MLILQVQVGLILLQILFVNTSCLHSLSVPIGRNVLRTQEVQKNASCSPWKYEKYHNSTCVCGDSINGIVDCNNDESTVKILVSYCMSYGDKNNTLLVGSCPYLCHNNVYTMIHDEMDIVKSCNHYFMQNRRGQMCGHCMDNFAPSPYTYTFECANCTSYEYNWVKYLLIAYLPLTGFFFAAIVLRLNAMSPLMNTLLLGSQLFVSSAVQSILSITLNDVTTRWHPTQPMTFYIVMAKVISSVLGVWNLDMFRMLYEPFCLHPNMSILQILSLDYAIAVYPLLLVCIVYMFIKLHDRFEIVQLLWKPAGWLIARIGHRWKISSSLIKPFGTFLLLAYVKIANTSFDILIPARLYNVSGNAIGPYLYYNGSMEYFGSEHLPYGVLAIFMFTTFNLTPLLLLSLYPCRCFQSCLNCCRINSQVLRTFMDAFQGCYKFEPYDCRYWAAVYLFLRLAVLTIFVITRNSHLCLLTGMLLILVVCLLAVLRPYKKDIYNTLDILLLQTYIIGCFSEFIRSSYDRRYYTFSSIAVGISLFVPIIYVLILALKWFVPNRLLALIQRKFRHADYVNCHNLTMNKHNEDPLLQSFDSE